MPLSFYGDLKAFIMTPRSKFDLKKSQEKYIKADKWVDEAT